MISVAISTAILIIAIVTLCVSTAVMSLGITTIAIGRRRRPQPPASVPIGPLSHRRVITGRPAVLPAHNAVVRPPIELGPAGGSNGPSALVDVSGSDDESSATPHPDEVREAVEVLERLIDEHPERLAELISLWINEDDRP